MNIRTMLVTGATGKTGSLVAAGLRQRGIAVRHGSRSGSPPFDWDDPSTWAAAVDGVDAVYIAMPIVAALRVGEPGAVGFRAEAVARFVPVAAAAGVRRLVLLSGRSARADPPSPYMLALERPIRSSDMDWTILSPGVFNQNFLAEPLRSAVRAGHVAQLATGPDARLDFTDVADVADCAIEVLTTPGHHGRVYELSGPRALTNAEAVQIIARTIGRALTWSRIELDDWAIRARADGSTQESIDFTVNAVRGHAGGAYSTPFDGVTQLLRRPPRSFESFVRDSATAWL